MYPVFGSRMKEKQPVAIGITKAAGFFDVQKHVVLFDAFPGLNCFFLFFWDCPGKPALAAENY